MALPTRQAAGIGGAATLLVAVGLLGLSLRSKLYGSVSSEVEWEARQLAQGASDAVRLKTKETEARVLAAASLNPVRALVAHSVDRATLIDAFSTEEWWRSFREEFPIVVLAMRGQKVDLGRKTAPDIDPLLAAVRQKSPASQLLFTNESVYFAAAALVETPARSPQGPSSLVLARPFLAGDLTSPPNFSGALVLSSGGVALFGAGAPEQLQLSQELLGKDPSTPLVGPDASWSAAAVELAPKLVLWARTSTLAKSNEVARTALSILGPMWGIAAVLAAACVYLGFRGRGRRPQAANPPAVVEPQGKVIVAAELAERREISDQALPIAAPQPILVSGASSTADPNQFGRYRLLRLLGEGSTMRADLGELRGAEGFSRLFVIKRLRPELASQPWAVAEFVERAQLGSSLVHSNIVPIYDFGRVENQLFLAQEHILGRDLGTMLDRLRQKEGQQLPAVLVFFIAQEILKALEYAHTHRNSQGEPTGIVHGNISPRKVLVSAMGEVRVLDFGIPHAKARAGRARQDRSAFLSPEQVRGEAIDARSDLFSLAMTMFWCLTGRSPYVAKTQEELFEKMKTGPGQEERDLIGTLGGAAAPLLKRALEASPEKRFQTAEAFAGAIPPWEMSRSAERLHRLMCKLFDEDFRAEQASQSDGQADLEQLSISEAQLETGDEVRFIGQVR